MSKNIVLSTNHTVTHRNVIAREYKLGVDVYRTACYIVVQMPPTTPVSIRIGSENLAKLEALGAAATPKPLNRSEMINVAVADYVRRNAPAEGRGKAKRG